MGSEMCIRDRDALLCDTTRGMSRNSDTQRLKKYSSHLGSQRTPTLDVQSAYLALPLPYALRSASTPQRGEARPPIHQLLPSRNAWQPSRPTPRCRRYCKPIDRQGDVVRSARVPLLYPCRYAREKLFVRENDRRCSPVAFRPRRVSVGRAHHLS